MGNIVLTFILSINKAIQLLSSSLFALHFRLLSMKTKIFKAATMTVIATVQISTCTWTVVTPFEWKEARGLCMKGPTLLGTCTSYLGVSILNTSIGWASTTASAPAELFTWWVWRCSLPFALTAPYFFLFFFFCLLFCERVFLRFSWLLLATEA